MGVRYETIRLLAAAALTLVIAALGCGRGVSTPDEQLPSEFAGAPNWVSQGCGAYWAEEDAEGARICGVGDAEIGRSMSIARTKATARARTEISRTLETKVKNMVKDYQEQVTDSESEMTTEQFSSTTVSLSKTTLSGTAPEQTWVSPSNRIYILVGVDVEAFENSVREMGDMSDGLRSFIESRARLSFLEMDDQMGDD